MELRDAVRRRRMVRAYDTGRPVPVAALQRVLEQAVRAPSAGFTQGWDFLVLRDPADRDLFWRTTSDAVDDPDRWLRGMMTAPVLVVCLSCKDAYLDRYAEPDKGWTDRDEARWPVPYWDVDTGMAALLMLLTAVDEGLAGCLFGMGPAEVAPFRAAFGVPEDRRPVAVVTLGHPAPDRRSPSLRRGRRPLAEVAHDGRFGRPWAAPSEGSEA